MVSLWLKNRQARTVSYPIILLLMNIGAGLLAPVLAVYFRESSLGFHEIGLIMSVFELSMFIFEIPTGVIADQWGRRISVLFCFGSFAVAGLVFYVSTDTAGFLLGSVLQGFGYTCISGALQAWVVDLLHETKKKDLIPSTILDGQQAKRGGFIVGSIIGGYLGMAYIRYNILMYTAINVAIFFYASISIKEKPKDVHEEREERKEYKRRGVFFMSRIPRSIGRSALILFMIAFFFESSAAPVEEFWTVYFAEVRGTSVVYLGWMLAISNALIVLLLKPATHFLKDRVSDKWFIPSVSVLTALSVLGIAVSAGWGMAAISFLTFRFLIGIYEPAFETRINDMIGSRHRATVLSLYNMAGSGGEVISVVGLGVAAEWWGMNSLFFICATGMIFTAFLYKGMIFLKENG